MLQTSFRDEILGLSLEMAWSLWAELAVSGWTRRHAADAVDLEPLILHTSWLGQFDQRLRDESVDWCITYSRFASGTRLKNLLGSASSEVHATFSDYSSTVKEHTRVSWPGNGTAWRLLPSGKSGAISLARPALIQLNLRAICGVSARAEVLKLLVSEPARPWSVAELAQLAAYGKANVATALSMLALAHLVAEERVGHSLRYRLASEPQLISLLGGRPVRFPVWSVILRIVEKLVQFATTTTSTRLDVRSVEIGGLLRTLKGPLQTIGVMDSPRLAIGTDLNYHFEAWATQLMRDWAHVPDTVSGELASDVEEGTYTIHRLTVPPGAWLGMVSNPHEQPIPLELPEWAEIYTDHPRSDTIVADDSNGALRIGHELMRLAERRAEREIGDYWNDGDGSNQTLARAFAEERLWTMRPGQSVTFGETFLRGWRRDRLERLRRSQSARRGLTK
jgi:hypothetical protein